MPVETYTTSDGEDAVLLKSPLVDGGADLQIECVRGIVYFGVGEGQGYPGRRWTEVDVSELFEALALLGLNQNNPKGAENAS